MKLKIPGLSRSEPAEAPPPAIGVAGTDSPTEGVILPALNHLQNLGRVRLAGLWEPVPARREAAGDALGIPSENRFSELEELLLAGGSSGRKGPEALLVAGPLEGRFETIQKALIKNTHVLSDAPLAPTAAEAESLVEAAASAGAHVGVIHGGRYCAINAEALGAVRQRKIGEIFFVRIERPRPKNRSQDATPDELLSELYPDIYLARAWADSPVTSVYARAESRRSRKGAGGLALLNFQHAGGGSSTLHLTDTVGPLSEAYEIHGEEGSIRLDSNENAWFLCRREEGADGARWERNLPRPVTLHGGATMEGPVPETAVQHYARALDDAFASFARGLPAPVDGREAWLNLRVLDTARESARTGEVIRVDIPIPR